MLDSFCYDPSVNYIPMAGETERLSDKLRELGSSRKLVVSSIFRASLLLDADSWESEQRFYEASKIGSTDIRGIVYALNYHKLANGKLCIIIDQALRFLVKKGKRAPLGVWEKKEIRSLRVLLRRMEEVRNKHIDEFVKYEVHIDKWAESKDHYREQRERLINEMGYSVEAVPGLFRAMWSRYLNQFATVFMQLPSPEDLSFECVELAASVVRGYPQYLKLLSLARGNPEKLKGINLEDLKPVEIQMSLQDDYGKRFLASYDDGYTELLPLEELKRLELLVLALSPCVEMCMLYSDETECNIMRERMRQLQLRRNKCQQKCPTHLQNWVLPGDTASDYGNHQANPLEHSVAAHWGGHYAVMPDSNRGVDTTLRLGGTNYDVGSSSTSRPRRSNPPERQGSSNASSTIAAAVAAPIPSLSEAKQCEKESEKMKTSTAGPSWFNLPAPDITPEIRQDLMILKNRSVLDPKRFYKREDKSRKELPKYFQIGTIIEGPTEFFSSRIPRKQRKQHIVDELLEDAESRQYFKKKFTELQSTSQNFTRRRKPNLKKLREARRM
ncbi:hypothetical protein SeLEV6574_g07551 [Synchytrium endobioticum]|uniref:Fcf2 pre-rRNA processing C-terminal domain-containing protein n=2 Tax=Synchytrium endobioticum TaxID=286115 RepID=A0A507CLE7_9FUNG|nr:hypothetical protein SeLEV6574_g07551 [Synchytrium endobioticum]